MEGYLSLYFTNHVQRSYLSKITENSSLFIVFFFVVVSIFIII